MEGGVLGGMYFLEPHGATFKKPALLLLPYDTSIPVERQAVFIVQAKPDSAPLGMWEHVSDAKFEGGKVFVPISHFSAVGVFAFPDVAKQRAATLTRTTNSWEAVKPGLIYRGKCQNPGCPQTGKVVNCNRGLGTFDVSIDIDNAKCPVCNAKFVAPYPDRFVLYDTEATVAWIKADRTRDSKPFSISNSEVLAFGINSFGDSGEANYRSLTIIARPGKNSSYRIDVCFALDCTGSMGSYIAAGKDQIIKIAQGLDAELKKKALNSKLRLSFIGYRDFKPDGSRPADILTVLPFTQNINDIVNTVSAQVASGGDDTPEHVVGALKEAVDMDWQGYTRVFVLIGDAPCHGSEYNDIAGATFPGGDPSGLAPPTFLNAMIIKDIDFFFMKINNSTDKMITKFRASYDSNPLNTRGRKIDEMPLGSDPNVLAKLVIDGVMLKINDLFI